ncbi:MAG TPA: PKD domain-containing protein, partial [Thermoanaerobaculia bacterium]
MKFSFKISIALLVLATFVSPAFAQTWSLPGKNTPVPCTTCVGTAKGKLTYPFSDPLVRHVGRFLDSSTTGNVQNLGMRTLRARGVRTYPDQNRMLFWIGETVVAYKMDTFFTSKLASGLVNAPNAFAITPLPKVGWGGRVPFEKVTRADQYFYAESIDSEWTITQPDSQIMLEDFDMDDRGYIYVSTIHFGWGLALDTGKTDGTAASYVTQIRGATPFIPSELFSLKVNNKYYAVASAAPSKSGSTVIFDVSSPQVIRPAEPDGARWVPPLVASRNAADGSTALLGWAKHEDSRRLALHGGDGKLRIYDYSSFISGGAALNTYSPSDTTKSFADMAFDESGNLWVAEKSKTVSSNTVWKITPAGTRHTYDVYGAPFNAVSISAAGGYVSVVGQYSGSPNGGDVVLLKVEGGTPRRLELNDFFRKYYARNSDPAYVTLSFQLTFDGQDATLVPVGNKVYLVYSGGGLGDVFELQAGESISAAMTATTFGTTNPNSRATENGPFYGDLLKFKATSNSNANYSIDWDFGNPDAGTANHASSPLNVDVPFQYTGLSTAAQVAAAKTVKASVSSDASISDEISVTMKVPKARITVPGIAAAITQENRTDFDLVLGDEFADASDGVVEGHYAGWVIDNVETKSSPTGKMGVGALGAHTLAFNAYYGKYNASTFTTTGTPFKSTINNVSYSVRPFTATILPPVTSGTEYIFNAQSRVTSVPRTVTATQWTVTWSLNNTATSGIAADAIVETQSETVPVGEIPPFRVPKSPSPDGKYVKLQITVDAASVPMFPSYSAQMKLSIPNIGLTKTAGCINAGEPCTVTASSLSTGGSTAGWNLQWSVRRNGTPVTVTPNANGLSVTFTPSTAGDYTVTAKETAYNVETTLPFTVAASTCGPVPDQGSVTIAVDCTTCAAGTPIRFEASIFPVHFQACDTFTWNFGDNTTSSERSPTHIYATTGRTYNVTLTIKNNNPTNGTGTWTRSLAIGGGGGGGEECVTPVAINFTYSGNQGCSPTVPCKTGEQITFSGRRAASPLLGCDTAAWTFDTEQSALKTPKYTFNTTGNHTVTLVVSNPNGQSTPVSQTLNIVQGGTQSCNGSVPQELLSMEFGGAQSKCGNGSSTPCALNETITFTANAFGYTFQACDRYEWNFGDGTPVATTRQATHTYTTARNSARVTLKVYNTNVPNGVTITADVPFTSVPDLPTPILAYAAFPSAGAKNSPVTFTVNANINSSGWSWDFNDGTAVDHSQASVVGKTTSITHTFTKTGTFNVRVTARNAEAASTAPTSFTVGTITVTDTPEYRYLLPVVTHIGGQGGSVWRTDVQIYNPDPNVSPSKPLVMTATLRDMNRTIEMFDSTAIYEDFMGRFTNGSDSGPVIITARSAIAPQIWTRTYNQTEAGTFGQFIPAIRLDQAGGGAAGETGKYFLAGLRATVRYRTNIGLVNPNTQVMPVTMVVYDDRGLKVGQFSRQVQPFQLLQFNAAEGVPNISPDRPFSVELSVPDGQRLVAYASYIDGGSNDPVYMQAVRESELASPDFRTGILPGVGHIGDWRSDVTVFNPNSRTVTVDLAYFDGTGTKKGEAMAVPIGAGEFLQYDDVLKQGVFSNVPDGIGMLRVSVPTSIDASVFPMMFARTYSDDGSGKTFGQGIRGFAAAQANVKPNKPALIPGVRKNSKYRTNIGLTNVSDAQVSVTVRVLDSATGRSVIDMPFTLKAFESIVAPDISLGSKENASIKIEVTGGNIWAFASIIDNGT